MGRTPAPLALLLSLAPLACGSQAGDGSPSGSGGPDPDGGSEAALPGDDATGDDAASTRDAADSASTPDARAAGEAEAGVDDGGSYDPCPSAGTPCVVLPLGDSITYGAGSSQGGGYRTSLFHLAHADGKSLTFVGSVSNGPAMVDGVPFPQANEGHPGYVIGGDAWGFYPGIAPLAPGAIQTYRPHIVLLMIGTNDVNLTDDLANAPARLGALMDGILQADARLLLVVAEITPTQTDSENATVQTYNAAIPGLVQTRAAAGRHVAMVDMYGAFTADANYKTTALSDNLHPNDTGYTRMAEVWYAKIGAFLR
jgi:hypothetical protein